MFLISKNEDGTVGLTRTTDEWGGGLAALGALVFGAGTQWRIADALPDTPQETWRWTDEGPLDVAPAAPPRLTPAQWQFFLDLTGFRATIDATLAALPQSTLQERAVYAGLHATAYASPDYSIETTLALAAQFGGANAPSEADIRQAWAMASQFEGAASLVGGGNG